MSLLLVMYLDSSIGYYPYIFVSSLEAGVMLLRLLMRLEDDNSFVLRDLSEKGATATIALSFFLKQGYSICSETVVGAIFNSGIDS